MQRIKDRIATVSGAGSGIGRATALALGAQGARVAVTDLLLERARETAAQIVGQGGTAVAFAMDVADAGQVRETAAAIRRDLGTPSLLVNNAGIAVGGYFLDTSLSSWQQVVAVNLMGVIHCCQAFLPGMVGEGKGGHVVNVSSMLGYTGMRGVSAYCATKFGVLGFSQSLRAELRDHRIGVSTICPGIIRTNIINAGILESVSEDVEARRAQIEAIYAKRNYPPEKVARAVLSAIRRNRAVVPVTPEAWIAWYATRWAPWLVAWLARREPV